MDIATKNKSMLPIPSLPFRANLVRLSLNSLKHGLVEFSRISTSTLNVKVPNNSDPSLFSERYWCNRVSITNHCVGE